jgi:hypothetical protein
MTDDANGVKRIKIPQLVTFQKQLEDMLGHELDDFVSFLVDNTAKSKS